MKKKAYDECVHELLEGTMEQLEGTMEQYRLLRAGKGDNARANSMVRYLVGVVSVGNLAIKLHRLGHSPHVMLGLPASKALNVPASKALNEAK